MGKISKSEIYSAFNYPGIIVHVGAISVKDGSVEKITDIKDPIIFTVTSLAYDPGSKTIFYTTDNHARRDVRSVNALTRQSRTLLKDARIGDLVFCPADKSLWGIRHFNGITTLVRIPPPYKEWKQVYSWPYGEVVYDIDVSQDGKLFSASFAEINGNQTLRVFKVQSLLSGKPESLATVEFGTAIPSNFIFSKDSKFLFGSSYYTGVSNIFRYEIATKSLEALSNTETGFFRPMPWDNNSLLVFRYTGEGFVPAVIDAVPVKDAGAITFLGQLIAEKYPIVKQWKTASPADVPIDSLITRKGVYRPLLNLKRESFYPVMEGYKDFKAVGMRFNFSDKAFWNIGSLTATYTPSKELKADERLHLQLRYQRYDWRVNFKYNAADFYDLFGPTKTSRKGYSFGLGYDKRYQAYYSFPGVKLNALPGKNYARTMIEWNLPPIRFRRAGTPGFYASWLRPSLFTSGLVTNMDDAALRKTNTNVGSQLDFRFSLLSRLDMTFSLGYAYAFGYSKHKHDEFMISLKILN